MTDHVPPLEGQLYAKVENWHDSATGESGVNEPIVIDIEKANVITSMIATKVTHHKVIIDLDIPAQLIPSTTPGHFHLYIDHEMGKDAYFKLIAALVEAGLVEPGYLGASEARGYTAVRLPWVKKEPEPVSETARQPGEHAWPVGATKCICGHPVQEHYSEEFDCWHTVMQCKVDGCDAPVSETTASE